MMNRVIFNVYVDGGKTLVKGEEWTLKKEFTQFHDKIEALEYKKMLESKFGNVVLEEKKFKHNFNNDVQG